MLQVILKEHVIIETWLKFYVKVPKGACYTAKILRQTLKGQNGHFTRIYN